MIYVIQRTDGAYVARSGSKSSYTRNLQHARPFNSRESAQRECCDNERVRSVDDCIYTEGT